MEQITVADVTAMSDVVLAITNESDSYDLEHTLAIRGALEALGKQVGDALAMLKTQAVMALDGGVRVVAGQRVHAEDIGKWRPNQDMIRSVVAKKACFDANTGERLSAKVAASNAVSIMYAMFVSPAAMPKAGGLKSLGLKNGDVAEWETTGTNLVMEAVEAAP